MKHRPYVKGWLPARAASNACQQQTDAMFDDLNGCIERAKAFRAKMDAAAAEKLRVTVRIGPKPPTWKELYDEASPVVERVPAWEQY